MIGNSKATITLLVLSLLLASASLAGPKEEAQKVISAWSSAFSAGNLELLLKTFSSDALFLGTGSKAIVSTPAGVREYFKAGISNLGNNPLTIKLLDQKEIVLSDGSVLVVALDHISGTNKGGKPFRSDGRVTFLVSKRGPKWLIVHFHRSAIPE